MASRRRIRAATIRDAAVLARHRVGMFRDMGRIDGDPGRALERGCRAWIRRALGTGELRAWVAVVDGEIVSGGGLLLRRLMPRPGSPRGYLEAYVLSVFTEEGHRRRGHALAVMRALLRWCGARGVLRVALHASSKGRPLYLSLGFEDHVGMRRMLGRRARRTR